MTTSKATSGSGGAVRRGEVFTTGFTTGFTIVELLVAIIVIGILAGLLIVGARGLRRSALEASERQTVNALVQGVESFRNEFGFLPPLVDEHSGRPGQPSGVNAPVNSTTHRINRVSFGTSELNRKDREFLRGYGAGRVNPNESGGTADYRYSEYSLGYYLVGVLGKKIDGVEGHGFLQPTRDEEFDVRRDDSGEPVDKQTARRISPFFDPEKGGAKMVGEVETPDFENKGLVKMRSKRTNTPYRYYRWLPGKANAVGKAEATNVAESNVPLVVAGVKGTADDGDLKTLDDPQILGAQYAIVSAGGDGFFGDMGTETGEAREEMKRVLRLPADATDEQLLRARNDNVVGVGK